MKENDNWPLIFPLFFMEVIVQSCLLVGLEYAAYSLFQVQVQL